MNALVSFSIVENENKYGLISIYIDPKSHYSLFVVMDLYLLVIFVYAREISFRSNLRARYKSFFPLLLNQN